MSTKNKSTFKNKSRKKNNILLTQINSTNISLGELLSKILLKNNINLFFGVPSDLNMPIIDEMLKQPVKFIGCRNELNSSYMSEGFARTKSFGFCVVGSMVGSLSASNGFSNSIAEKNPILMICGGNNSHDILEGKLSHHTLFQGIEDQAKSYEIFNTICGQDNTFMVNSINESGIFNTINNISNSLSNFNSAYIHIPANLQKIKDKIDFSDVVLSKFQDKINNYDQFKFSNIIKKWINLHFNNDINKIIKLQPVFLFGSAYNHYSKFIKLADEEFYNLMETINAKIFFTIDAKGILDENNKNVIGYYWGGVTEEYKLKMFDVSKALVYIGVEFSDYTTTGYTCLFSPHFEIDCKNTSILNIRKGKLNNIHFTNASKILSSTIENNLNSNTDIFVETGSSWYYGSQIKLPYGCRYNISMKYGSIGWCFPASIGNAFANPSRKTISLTGDGAFQMVLQELGTAIKYNVNLTLILINNNVYQVENVLDTEEYNDLPVYDYEELARAMKCKNVTTCSLDTFNNTLKKYNSMPGFNFIVLKISDKVVDNLMKNWAKLVSKYTVHYV